MVVKKKGAYELVSFESGRRLNMVPDFAEAVVTGEDVNALTVAYEEYLQTAKKIGEAIVEGNTVTLQIKGFQLTDLLLKKEKMQVYYWQTS